MEQEQQEQQPEMSGEQAADLQRLMSAAETQENDAEKSQQVEVERIGNELMDRNAQGLSMLIDLAGPTLAQFGFPSVAVVLGHKDDSGMTRGQLLASVWAPVLTKYGVDMAELGGTYKVEITAIFVSLPIVKALRDAVMFDVSVRRAAEAAKQGPQAPKAERVRGAHQEEAAALP
ncbi:hypothetical protein [Janthinobacterium sp. LB2P10]|uniref:hypothetical protein n=1 Tax=Janthinobacterium sp. LB2P10 TaxID=3424194 RepID=UPI003F1E70C9